MSDWKNEALRKIGRNLVNLSKIEGMLKLFLSRVNFQCPINELQSTLEAKKKRYEKMTLGQVIKDYLRTYNSDLEQIHQYPDDRKEAWVSFSFTTETEALAIHKRDYDFLIRHRNKLVHELLIRFNPESEKNCKALIEKLDEQHQHIQRHSKYQQQQLYVLDEAIRRYFMNQSNQ
ncbi:hypothetical protein ACFODZ_03840 [Marinicella sediminis]|uniref:Uncharacterized protein n=2 Tax=Marinicella sediminis TaxID=1792834 RepID=A0ABV7JBB5_9GAMM